MKPDTCATAAFRSVSNRPIRSLLQRAQTVLNRIPLCDATVRGAPYAGAIGGVLNEAQRVYDQRSHHRR